MRNNFLLFIFPLRNWQYIAVTILLLMIPGAGTAKIQKNAPSIGLRTLSSILAIPEHGTAIVVDKSTQTLFLYASSDKTENSLAVPAQKILTFPCSTGEVAGPKEQQGDKKTPEGIYFLEDEYEDKYLAPVYGKKAFPTDYPNYIDRQQGKNGSAIWIHGTDKPLRPMTSNGCIALENDNIMALADKIVLNKTPVILTDQIRECSLEELQTRKKLAQDLVHTWLAIMESASYHEYLACYSSSHMPDMFWWNQWKHLRQKAKEKKHSISLAARHMGIYQHQDVTVAIMELYLNTESASIFLGIRKLFLQCEGTTMKIVGDVYQSKPACFARDSFPLIAAANVFLNKKMEPQEVEDTVKAWLKAWSAKDMQTYESFYAPDFTGNGLSRQEWFRRKRSLARRYQSIQVTGEEFTITKNKNIMVVRFFQKYRATGFATNGYKELQLAHIGGSWKIFQEIWKGK